MAISGVVVLLLVLVVVGIVWSLFRRPGLFVIRGPRKRSIVTRVICGTLGAGILIVLTVGTLHAVNKTYEPSTFPPVTAHVPTLPPPTPAETPGAGNPRFKNARLLIQLVLLDPVSTNQVVRVGEMDMRWVEGQPSCRRETRLTVGKTDFELVADISQVNVDARAKGKVSPFGILTLRGTDDHGPMSSSRAGVFSTGLIDFFGIRSQRNPSSVNTNFISLQPVRGDNLWAIAVITVLADDDPLKEVPGQQLMAMQGDEMRLKVEVNAANSILLHSSVPALGLAAVSNFGFAAVSLLAATILLTQLFTRRTMAFAGVMAVVLLYAAAMDRVVLGMNVAHLNDPTASPVMRITACRQTAMSFFYGKTALREIQAVAADASAPSALQACAKQTTQTMEDQARSDEGG